VHTTSPFRRNITLKPAHESVQLVSAEESTKSEEEESFEDPFDEGFELDEAEIAVQTIADPIEPVNRAFFTFNDKLYFWALKPVASGYKAVIPQPIRLNVRNFFSNLAFPVRFVNCILQGNIGGAVVELSRAAVNTFLGVGGLYDAATGLNLQIQQEDFGQTLGVWGIGPGAFINLPLFGPSSVRDVVGRLGDAFLYPLSFISIGILPAIGVRAFEQVNKTSLMIGEYEALKDMALDPYVAMRNAYHQLRLQKVSERSFRK
jgi:phospholipid-binding lipoprotein MlaA